jgi:hypothetical protein
MVARRNTSYSLPDTVDIARESPEAAFDRAIGDLLEVARRSADAAVRRGDEIDKLLADIRALRAEPVV